MDDPELTLPWPHPSLAEARYTCLPKAWRTQKRWYRWECHLEEGKWTIRRATEATFTHHQAYVLSKQITHARAAGVGYAFPEPTAESDPHYLQLEIARCRNVATGELDELATEVLQLCPEAYVEVSPSGRDLLLLATWTRPRIPQVRRVTCVRQALRPGFKEMLDPSLILSPAVGYLALSGFTLRHHTGEAGDCTAGLCTLLDRYLSPPPPVLADTPEPWEQITVQMPEKPYHVPDRFSALTATCPLARSLWQLTPQIVPEGMDYTLALLVQAAHANWSMQEMCELACAFHRKHGRSPMELRHYQQLILRAIDYTFDQVHISPHDVLVG